MRTHSGINQEEIWSKFAHHFPKWLQDYVRYELLPKLHTPIALRIYKMLPNTLSFSFSSSFCQ